MKAVLFLLSEAFYIVKFSKLTLSWKLKKTLKQKYILKNGFHFHVLLFTSLSAPTPLPSKPFCKKEEKHRKLRRKKENIKLATKIGNTEKTLF